jgi:phosphoribosylanthranilate isomerase
MWIKICANTNLEDALLASELGAHAVGFVFAPSKRQVTATQVAAIVPALPETIEKIGVFSMDDASEVAAIVTETGLTGVQLHGDLDLELARQLREKLGNNVTIIQTIHWKVDGMSSNAAEVREQLEAISREPAIDRVLIDSKTAKASGGTGVSFDWTAARETLRAFEGKLIVAGGLRPDNVATAIEALEPWGVDVASGVEAAPGKKDREKILGFIAGARPSLDAA